MKILPTFILILSLSIYMQANTNNLMKKKNTHTEMKKKTYPGVEWKPKDGQDKYPGVEWKPKNGDPKPHIDRNTYPGVEWTPKK